MLVVANLELELGEVCLQTFLGFRGCLMHRTCYVTIEMNLSKEYPLKGSFQLMANDVTNDG